MPTKLKSMLKKIWHDKYFYKKYREELQYNPIGNNDERKDTRFDFRGKNILVFGGTGGVGEKVVNQFLAAGGQVMVIGRNKDKFNRKFSIKEKVTFFEWDMNAVVNYERKIDEIVALFGRIDIAVNCIGFFTDLDRKQNFYSFTKEDMQKSFELNFFQAYFILREITKYMIHNNISGRICSVASITGIHSYYGITPYGLSKAALIHYIKGLALEVAPYHIICNAICPGPIATTMSGKEEITNLYSSGAPNKRIATPEEIASTILFMVSDDAANLNGVILVSDGGEILRGYGG